MSSYGGNAVCRVVIEGASLNSARGRTENRQGGSPVRNQACSGSRMHKLACFRSPSSVRRRVAARGVGVEIGRMLWVAPRRRSPLFPARHGRCSRARHSPPTPRMASGGVKVLAFPSSREWRNWQTRWLQVPVLERAWGFKSPLAHANMSWRQPTHTKGPRAIGGLLLWRTRERAASVSNGSNGRVV